MLNKGFRKGRKASSIYRRKASSIYKYVSFTLLHVEKSVLPQEVVRPLQINDEFSYSQEVVRRLQVNDEFDSYFIIVASEFWGGGVYHLHGGAHTSGLSKRYGARFFRSLFPEFQEDQLILRFRKGLGPLCYEAFQRDKAPRVWVKNVFYPKAPSSPGHPPDNFYDLEHLRFAFFNAKAHKNHRRFSRYMPNPVVRSFTDFMGDGTYEEWTSKPPKDGWSSKLPGWSSKLPGTKTTHGGARIGAGRPRRNHL